MQVAIIGAGPLGRRLALAAGVAVLLVAAFGVSRTRQSSGAGAPPLATQHPTLLLLTSLPLMFGEDFSLEGSGSPALTLTSAL